MASSAFRPSGGELEREEREAAFRGQAEAVQRRDCSGGFPGPGDVVPDPQSQIFEAVCAQQEPEFEGPEPASERDRPLAVIGDFGLPERLEVFRTDTQGPGPAVPGPRGTELSNRTARRAICGG